MSYLIGFVFVMLVLSFLVTTGAKQMFINAAQRITSAFKISAAPAGNKIDDSSATMKIVQLTQGTCEMCGTVFVGTAEDPADNALQVLHFGDQKKVVCQNCYNEVARAFGKSEKSGEVNLSASAKAFSSFFTQPAKKSGK